MRFLVLFMSLLSLQAFATDFSKSYQRLFLSQDQEIVKGTERAIQIANKTGRNVIMVFPGKTITAANGEKSAATVTVTAQDQNAPPKKDDYQVITGLSFEGLIGAEVVPAKNDDGEDVLDGKFLFTERIVVRLFNNRAAAYVGSDWNVDPRDNLRLGGRLNIHADEYDNFDFYAYYEQNVGKPKDATKADMTRATGLGILTTTDNGHGFILESGIAWYNQTAQGDGKRGLRVAAGYVKQWGNKKRPD